MERNFLERLKAAENFLERLSVIGEQTILDARTFGHPLSMSPPGILYNSAAAMPSFLDEIGRAGESMRRLSGPVGYDESGRLVSGAGKVAIQELINREDGPGSAAMTEAATRGAALAGGTALAGSAPKGALRANIGRNKRVMHVSPRAERNFLFDEQRVGSGEGGAAFGWGANLTDSPTAVKWYKDNLGGRVFETELPPGQYLDWDQPIGSAALAKKFGYSGEPVVKWGETGSGRLVVDMGGSTRVLGKIAKDGNVYTVTHRGKSLGTFGSKERAQAALETVGESAVDVGQMTGRDLYMGLEKRLGSKKAASKALAEMDIKGMRIPADYASGSTKGAYDYVVFSPDGLLMKEGPQ